MGRITCVGAPTAYQNAMDCILCGTGTIVRDYGTPKERPVGFTQGDITLNWGITDTPIEHNSPGSGAPFKNMIKREQVQPSITYNMLEHCVQNFTEVLGFEDSIIPDGKSFAFKENEILGAADGTLTDFALPDYDPNDLKIYLYNPDTGECEQQDCVRFEHDATAETSTVIFETAPPAPFEVVAAYWCIEDTPEGSVDCHALEISDVVNACQFWDNVAFVIPFTLDPKSGLELPADKCQIVIIIRCVRAEPDSGLTFSQNSQATSAITLMHYRDPCRPCQAPLTMFMPKITAQTLCCPTDNYINPVEGKKVAA